MIKTKLFKVCFAPALERGSTFSEWIVPADTAQEAIDLVAEHNIDHCESISQKYELISVHPVIVDGAHAWVYIATPAPKLSEIAAEQKQQHQPLVLPVAPEKESVVIVDEETKEQ